MKIKTILLEGAGIMSALSISMADSPDMRVPCILAALSLALVLLAMVAGAVKVSRERRIKRNLAVQHHRERMREMRASRRSCRCR
jgi:choline-glycine betaine transporter